MLARLLLAGLLVAACSGTVPQEKNQKVSGAEQLSASCETIYLAYADGSLAADYSTSVKRDCLCVSETLFADLSPEDASEFTKLMSVAAKQMSSIDLHGQHGLATEPYRLLETTYSACVQSRAKYQRETFGTPGTDMKLYERMTGACANLVTRPGRSGMLADYSDAVLSDACENMAFISFEQYKADLSVENAHAMLGDVELLEAAIALPLDQRTQAQTELIDQLVGFVENMIDQAAEE